LNANDPIAAPDQAVNPHFLTHVVNTSDTHAVEASEDILAANGMKLLARGTRIDAASRERLLAHKLRKSLEDSVTVVNGVNATRFGPLAEQLLDEHPLLARLCVDARWPPVAGALGKLLLSAPACSMLSVLDSSQRDRLRHAVGVAMVAMGLSRRLRPHLSGHHQTMGLAGLLHDVGELYIDPKHFAKDTPLEPERWRNIVSHPLVGYRVLHGMVGVGPTVAEAVLLHHERLNGHGYPRGVMGERFTLDGQIVAVAEWLMALVDSGLTPISRASVATKLLPGEFAPELLESLTNAAPTADEIAWVMEPPNALELHTGRVTRIATVLDNFRLSRQWMAQQLGEDIGACKPIFETASLRLSRLQIAFSSAGLDTAHPDILLRELGSHNDPALQLEVLTILHELEWRLRDLERRAWQRAVQLSPRELSVVHELVQRVKGNVSTV
jgi:HD-GYP domain-containing protein (c-di-GMP phosphodiesterase class II)